MQQHAEEAYTRVVRRSRSFNLEDWYLHRPSHLSPKERHEEM